MESIIKCCVPGCDGYSKTKHVSFYGVKPEWNRPILGYINSCTRSNSSKAKECTKLRSNVICGRHFHLCTVRESSLTTTIYFPHLKISVERESQRGSERRITCELNKTVVFSFAQPPRTSSSTVQE
jgi:hypothetical protein